MRRTIGRITSSGGYQRLTGNEVAVETPRATAGIVREYEHIAHSLPDNDPDIPHRVQSGLYKGKPAFRSRREIAEYEAKKAADGMHLQFGGD